MDPSTGHSKSSFSVSVLLNIAGVDANLLKKVVDIFKFINSIHLQRGSLLPCII